MGMRPIVVASPSLQAFQEKMKDVENVDEDISKTFDSSRGLHKVKSVRML